MVAKKKKKYSSGEGAQFMTRKAALKRLQLSIKDFRRLCILKGIYPREPRNRKRAQKGQGGVKTLYHTKDIQFLFHEPIIWKMRDIKVYYRRIQKAKSLRDKTNVKRYLNNFPVIKIDHIVKERYPTFIDALRDLDDCLTLCFLFSTFPSIKHVPREVSILCRRLTVEFMHAVIAANALRKVFVSIKGYYYQAEIKGQIINWIVPHHFGFQPQTKEEVDFKLMATFVEFYTVMLGFVNFRLYHSLNLEYPPKLTEGVVDHEKILIDEEVYVSERISTLNVPLIKVDDNPEEEMSLDQFPNEEDPQKLEEARQEAEKIKKLKTLFKGLKFFINREVPREPLVFLIKCFGGEVSWDKMLFVGASFDENDESITHHIVDRPSMDKKFISRYYIQPQWIFDCVNMRTLLPVNKYLMGATLPPHLSPFIDKEKDQVYIPPEARAINDPNNIEKNNTEVDSEPEIEKATDEETDDENANANMGEAEFLEKVYNDEIQDDSDSSGGMSSDDENVKNVRQEKKKGMAVLEGQLEKEVPFEKERQNKLEYRLREKMIKKKHRRLYRSMMDGKKKRMKEIWLLRKKRRIHDEKAIEEKQGKAPKTTTKTS